MSCSVIIPTKNAGTALGSLLQSLWRQEAPPNEILVVDSSSQDDTVSVAKANGARIIQISPDAFDHGGTRNFAVRNTDSDFVIFFTQDALPVDEKCILHLLVPMDDFRIAACSGRQVASMGARPYEKLVRQYRYPPICRFWTKEQIPKLGIHSYHLSNVCAAYRRSAWESVGGFDYPLLTNEDMLIAQKFLDAGWTLAYCGDAQVWHSHSFTWRQEFLRNRLIGSVLEEYATRFVHLREKSEGIALARYVFNGLIAEHEYMECFYFATDCVARFAGNQIGRLQKKLAHKSITTKI